MDTSNTKAMGDFEALTSSIGENLVDWIGKDRLVALHVLGWEPDATFDVTITLRDQSWASRERAVAAVVTVRELFIDEATINFVFGPQTEDADAPVQDGAALYAMA